ncbi:MAG: hypothetical protein PHY44_04155 [Lachnospiraceae bacterium]|nr:hypothetical protein [Lachnospiraceae bacterium]
MALEKDKKKGAFAPHIQIYYIKFKNYNQGGEGVNIDLEDIERKIVS